MLVTLAVLLFLLQLLAGMFTDFTLSNAHVSQDHYISISMRWFTTLMPFAAMVWCGRQRGSRRGLWSIGVLAALMTLMAGQTLTTVIAYSDGPRRALGLADLFGASTVLNWVAFVVFAGFAVVTHVQQEAA